jgi:hypothetical protein
MAGTACSRSHKNESTTEETQTQTPTPTTAMTATIQGCLRTGEMADTYMLMQARTSGENMTANYQLDGGDANVLKDHVGQQVKVSGTALGGDQIASGTTAVEQGDKAKGTSGTPVVQTQTDLSIRRFRVDQVTPTGEKCQVK